MAHVHPSGSSGYSRVPTVVLYRKISARFRVSSLLDVLKDTPDFFLLELAQLARACALPIVFFCLLVRGIRFRKKYRENFKRERCTRDVRIFRVF